MNKKYVVFSPYRSGLANVVMSCELAFAIAVITNRTLILPPTIWLTHITEGAKENWVSLWDLFDYSNNDFDTLALDEHPELHDKLAELGDHNSWFSNASRVLADCYSPAQIPCNNVVANADFCVVNNARQYKGQPDFISFVAGRKLIELDRSEQYLLLENSLFQHYWYWVYAGDAGRRNALKTKVNKLFRYSQKFYDKVGDKVTGRLGPYNAIHVRRGNFFIQYGDALQTIATERKLLIQIEKVISTALPLYIATDEADKNYFSEVAKKYDLYFFDDFFEHLSPLECAILEQIICSQAEQFEGTIPSTYTKRINVMRGLDGRSANDYTGVNMVVGDTPPMQSALPWTMVPERRWGWSASSHPQWMQEQTE